MASIQVEVPRSHHPLTNLRMKHSQGESVTEVDVTAMRFVEIELPEGVTEDEVEIVGEFCDARGQRDEGMDLVVVKAANKADDKPPTPPADKPAASRGRKALPKADDKPADQPAADAPATDAPAADAAKS